LSEDHPAQIWRSRGQGMDILLSQTRLPDFYVPVQS
jgi:hypothetical protein